MTASGRNPAPPYRRRRIAVALVLAGGIALIIALVSNHGISGGTRDPRADAAPTRPVSTATSSVILPTAPTNIYAGIGPGRISPAVAHDLPRIYVPDGGSNQITVIDPTTRRVVDTFSTGRHPQHVVPSWDLRTLWVLDNGGNDVFPIDPRTGRPGRRYPVDDPYNLYFTPDGSSAIVVAEARRRLDFRDPHTMRLRSSLPVPGCTGINHTDYSADDSYMLVTCEFAGSIAKIDMVHRRVLGLLRLGTAMNATESQTPRPQPASGRGVGPTSPSMPQDVRAGPDGRHFYVADMADGGVHVIDGDTFTVVGFIATGPGAHGITPSRDGRHLYVANRGSTSVAGPRGGPGSVSVVDPSTNTVVSNWPVPNGGSPDMGNLSVDGTRLWLSGRFDAEVYAFDTRTGRLAARIPVGDGPHGLTVWPQPGTYSLGHTGNMR